MPRAYGLVGPGVTQKAFVSRQLVENIDITPTLVSLCGLPPMDTVDGCDLTPLLKGWRHAGPGDRRHRECVEQRPRWGPWRFVYYPKALFGADVGELYNLENDPNETREPLP